MDSVGLFFFCPLFTMYSFFVADMHNIVFCTFLFRFIFTICRQVLTMCYYFFSSYSHFFFDKLLCVSYIFKHVSRCKWTWAWIGEWRRCHRRGRVEEWRERQEKDERDEKSESSAWTSIPICQLGITKRTVTKWNVYDYGRLQLSFKIPCSAQLCPTSGKKSTFTPRNKAAGFSCSHSSTWRKIFALHATQFRSTIPLISLAPPLFCHLYSWTQNIILDYSSRQLPWYRNRNGNRSSCCDDLFTCFNI